jgi:histidine decarboxylase
MEQRVDYIGSVDSTILSSRSGLAVLFMWQAICRRNFAVEARKCRRNAEYLRTALQLLGWEPQLNPLSTTVVFKSPDKAFCNHWQLSTSHDRAHVVVMQNHSRTWLDRFLKDLGTRQSGEWRHELDHFDPNHAASAPGKLSL